MRLRSETVGIDGSAAWNKRARLSLAPGSGEWRRNGNCTRIWKTAVEKTNIGRCKVSPAKVKHVAGNNCTEYGLNRVEEERGHPLLTFLGKFWAPVPWMLEATVVLEILGHKHDEAIISLLLILNASLSVFQENQANRALTLPRKKLSITNPSSNNAVTKVRVARSLTPYQSGK